MTLTISTGKAGCPCINTTSTLASLTNRYCILPDGKTTGIKLTLGGSCVPFSYGSNNCKQFDLLHDPKCILDEIVQLQQGNINSTNNAAVPSYCFQPFCYVDAKTCKKNSVEHVYRSTYFASSLSREEDDPSPIFDVDIFYSYSTCNSTAEDWLKEGDIVGSSRLFGGIDLEVAVPTYIKPYMYKRDSNGDILIERGDEYYNDNIPYEGVYIHFAKQIMDLTGGDIKSMNFTHRSKVSDIEHPTSSFTAAIQDLKNGLVDMAVGPFWVTSQRLRMASFSLPFAYDKTYLVIPKPSQTDSLAEEVRKVLAPFSYGLWGLVLGVIAATALLSVWFTDRSESKRSSRPSLTGVRSRKGKRRRMKYYGRMALDQCLEKGIFFCSAGVEQDERSSLPTKMLLFGFGFFILIAVSAYVANLAAFLTMSRQAETVKTIDGAIAAGYRICAHPALSEEYQQAYPEADFYFHEDGREFLGVLDDYVAGKCKVLAIGYEDTSMDPGFLKEMCANDLVYSDSVLTEVPMAFPMRQDIQAGFNYWMFQAEREGVNLQASKDEFPTQIECDVDLSEEVEGDEMDAITVKNFFLPIMFFVVCVAIAILVQVRHMSNVKKGRKSLMGRRSSFNLMAQLKHSNQNAEYEEESDFRDEEEMSTGGDIPQQSAERSSGTNNALIRSNSLVKGDLPSKDTFNENGKKDSPKVSFGNVQFDAEEIDLSDNDALRDRYDNI